MEYVINPILLGCEFLTMAYICSTWLQWRWKQCTTIVFLAVTVPVSFLFTEYVARLLPDSLKSILTVFIACIYSVIFFRGNTFLKLLLILCCHVLGYGMDYVAVSAVCAIKQIDLQTIIAQPVLFTICSLFSKLLMVLSSYFIHMGLRKKHRRHKNILQWLQMLFYPIVSLGVIVLLLRVLETRQETSMFFISVTIGLLLATVLQLAIIEKMDSDAQLRQDALLLQQKYELQSQNMQNILAAYREQRRIDHDHANQLLALQGALDESPSHAKVYLEKLIGSQGQASPIYQTGNSVADALINVKSVYARQLKLSVTIKICNLRNISLSDDELAIVFGNLLDNAIQAAAQCNCNQFIDLRLEPLHEKTLLRITNSYTPKPATQKEDIQHGFGLKNVHLVLDKYGCSYRVRKTENTYTTVVELPITPTPIPPTSVEVKNNDLPFSAKI